MDIRFEQCCVLYNIGALHSALGTMETRQSSDGMKISCTHFQCGAWAFQQLAKGFDCSVWSPDMNAFVMDFMSTLLLAQVLVFLTGRLSICQLLFSFPLALFIFYKHEVYKRTRL